MMKEFFRKTAVAVICLGVMLGLGAAHSNDLKRWYFERNADPRQPPGASAEIDLAAFCAYYLGDTKQKELYLTFDEGYENGFTAVILDVLLDKGVPAAFFVTKSYIRDNPELIKRMIDEGHVVGNHTVRHKSSPGLTVTELEKELTDTADFFHEQTGQEMPPFFRPPMGEYSAQVLAAAQKAGYSTIFWSFAYKDWLVDAQPGAAAAHKKIMENLHNGEIMLLHAVSSSNAEALGGVIDAAKAQGYEFKSLWCLPNIIND